MVMFALMKKILSEKQVVILGRRAEPEDLYLEIRPSKWNTAWTESTDEVTARISGEGFEDIVFDTLRMIGPGGVTLQPVSYELAGFAFAAKFLQSQAILLIPDAESGRTYEIRVTGEIEDALGVRTPFDVSCPVDVKGKRK